MTSTLKIQRSAVLSQDGRYRYVLRRWWRDDPDPLRHVSFILCNPSTADAERDDQTVRKCVGFAERWGAESLAIFNAYALRATDPNVLRGCDTEAEAFGPHAQAQALADCFAAAARYKHRIVLGWGEAMPVPLRAPTWGRLRELARQYAVQPLCLGRTASGQPRHPLILPYRTRPCGLIWPAELG